MKGNSKGILFVISILTFMFLAVYSPTAAFAAPADLKQRAAKVESYR